MYRALLQSALRRMKQADRETPTTTAISLKGAREGTEGSDTKSLENHTTNPTNTLSGDRNAEIADVSAAGASSDSRSNGHSTNGYTANGFAANGHVDRDGAVKDGNAYGPGDDSARTNGFDTKRRGLDGNVNGNITSAITHGKIDGEGKKSVTVANAVTKPDAAAAAAVPDSNGTRSSYTLHDAGTPAACEGPANTLEASSSSEVQSREGVVSRGTDKTEQTQLYGGIAMEDLEAALEGFSAESLRGAGLFQSSVEWGDVGGLRAVRAEIREILEVRPTVMQSVFFFLDQ